MHDTFFTFGQKTGINIKDVYLTYDIILFTINWYCLQDIPFAAVLIIIYGSMCIGTVNLIGALKKHGVHASIQLVKVDGSRTENKIVQIRNKDGFFHD